MKSQPTNFWNQKEPIIALAPMAGVTDSPFRQMCKKFGAPVVFAEFVSVRGLHHNWEKSSRLLSYTPEEQPVVMQIFGDEPEFMAEAAERIEEVFAPAGIDMNCGCPAKKVMKTGAGVSLMKHPELVSEIIETISERISTPLSLKTRAGIGDVNAYDFVTQLPLEKLAGLTIHGRTFEQRFSGPIDVDLLARVKTSIPCPLIVNGGIASAEDMNSALEATNADGVMVGAGALGKPWIFQELVSGKSFEPSLDEQRRAIIEHAQLMIDHYGEERGLLNFRKHLLWYVRGFEGAKQLRKHLADVSSLSDIRRLLEQLS